MWRQYYPDSSSSFLWNQIHSQIQKEYLQNEQKKLADIQQSEALELSGYLQDIKRYANGLGQANYLQDEEWIIFLDFLNSIEGRNGRFLDKLFRVPDNAKKRQHRFEQDLTAVSRSIEKTLKTQNINFGIVNGGNIQLGQQTTNVQINQELFANKKIDQEIMQHFGVRTKRYFESIGKTAKALNPVSVKVDVAGGQTIVTQTVTYEQNKVVPNFNRFAQLMLSASFSAKNYSKTRSGVNLEKTQMLRVLLDFLPQLNSTVQREQAMISFLQAIITRIKGIAKEKDVNDNHIDEVLGQLDFIYRLTGRGQTYDTDSVQLNNYLQQGAKYLIYNQHNSENIWVASTRYLIYKKLESLEDKKLRYGHSMNIAKGLIKG